MMTDRLFCELLQAQQEKKARAWAEERAAYEQMKNLPQQATYTFDCRKGEVSCKK